MSPEMIITLGGISTAAAEKSTPISAVSYTSEIIDNTTVVTLTPTDLIEADRATAELVGLTLGETKPVGHTRIQTLRFPAWAVVNDPEHATLALSLIPELQKAENLTVSKAKTHLKVVARTIEEDAPQLLPTFYEEAARIFLKQDSTAYASQMFNRARESERHYGLPIDNERQQQAFVDFAVPALSLPRNYQTKPALQPNGWTRKKHCSTSRTLSSNNCAQASPRTRG